MFRIISCSLALLFLSACSQEINDAKQILEDSLPIVKEIEYRNFDRYDGSVVCGEFSAYTSHVMPKADYAPFIVVRGELINPPTELQQKIYCSEDPAQALLEQTGVGPYTANNAELAKITRDFTALDQAIWAFNANIHKYPTAAQTLDILVNKQAGMRLEQNYREGGYIDAIPVDPWGEPYLYEEEQWGRVEGRFTLTTLGADGAIGGAGANADVSSELLAYLQHIAIVLGQQ